MVRLKTWQWVILASPIAAVVGFLLFAAGRQIHEWGINWVWAIFPIIFVGWRWLLVKWTKPIYVDLEATLTDVTNKMNATVSETTLPPEGDTAQQLEAILQNTLKTAENDPPAWENWPVFWQRCLDLVSEIAKVYHPKQKYPLLNIYIPQAYGLIRGTVDDVDQWMRSVSPVLNQVTIGQAYQGYEVYRKVEPSARKLLSFWSNLQWVLNPAVAAAKVATQKPTNQANQQLLGNLNQVLRDTVLRNLARQSIALYGNMVLPISETINQPKQEQTKTLREILAQVQPVEKLETQPVNIFLFGRTGAGKSSLINTLFKTEKAKVDVLPSTDVLQNYEWQLPTGESLSLWDSPGYEQIDRPEFRAEVLSKVKNADILLLVTPALDPALQMDLDFLKDVRSQGNFPTIVIVTQVDQLRPIREWQPPYDWQWGDRPKEKAIREATQYRSETLGKYCDRVLPLVTDDYTTARLAWGADALSLALIEAINPAKQLRLARFLRDLDARIVGAAKIIERSSLSMTTTSGVTVLLKSPILRFISTVSTGNPSLAYVLAQQIPVEKLPLVIGKLQMAYELSNLLGEDKDFDLLTLWPLLLENTDKPDRDAWAFGHALVEFLTKNLSIEELRQRIKFYL